MSKQCIERLREVLGPEKVLTGVALSTRYHHIWQMEVPLAASAVLLPSSTEDVSQALKICSEHQQPISIQGGLTNLVGGTETSEKEIVLSLEKMNKIIELDASSRSMTVEAGVILENIHLATQEQGLFFPLNFGAKGSAQIGGIISTNAGGLRVLRYGMTRALILGVEAVMMDGTVISSLKKIIKDNSGYDLKQLFIGSEGTLGIVTKAVLKLSEAPSSRASAMVTVDHYEKVVQLLKHMDSGLAGRLTGFELMWANYYEKVTSPPASARPPLPHGSPYYVLIESLGSDQKSEDETMEKLLASALEKNLISDGTMAHTQSDFDWFWNIREDVHAAVSQMTHDQHFDISLPIPLIGKTLNDINEKLKNLTGVNGAITFGHVADGNIHVMVDKQNQSQQLTDDINDIVYGPLGAIEGSISAEHGIGLHKKAYLHVCRTAEEINLMQTLKKAMDPGNLLNRNRIFDI